MALEGQAHLEDSEAQQDQSYGANIRRSPKHGSQANRCLSWEPIIFMKKRRSKPMKHPKNTLERQKKLERRAKKARPLC